jgi:hypothetical protein
MTENERDARESMKGVLIAIEACIALMIRKGKIGAVATTDEAAMGHEMAQQAVFIARRHGGNVWCDWRRRDGHGCAFL